MSAASKHRVTIKGVRDGLVFHLDDSCRMTDLLDELQAKVSKTHQKILSGPLIHVQVKLGGRMINEAEKEQIREIITERGNLLVQSIETELLEPAAAEEPERTKTVTGIIRSGQTLRHDGSIFLLGDVNPGGSLFATGDIFVLGSLRGMAHAGTGGDERAVIAASHLQPTQLRIADVISRPPEEWGIENAYMEFAYIRDGAMEIDKMNRLHRVRPETG